jgi:hypothetical protein
MSPQRTLIEEIKRLPSDKLNQAIDYIRFLRIQAPSSAMLEKRFERALQTARSIAKKKKITDSLIFQEIQRVRAAAK